MAEPDGTHPSELATETLVAGLGTIADCLRADRSAVSALYIREAAARLERLAAEAAAETVRAETAEAALTMSRATAQRLNRRATEAEGPLTRRVINAERDRETLRAAHQEASLRSATNLRRAELAEAHTRELDSLLATAQREVETLRARLSQSTEPSYTSEKSNG